MIWWLALAATALGGVFLAWYMWAALGNRDGTTTDEERLSRFGWQTLFMLALALLVLAILQ